MGSGRAETGLAQAPGRIRSRGERRVSALFFRLCGNKVSVPQFFDSESPQTASRADVAATEDTATAVEEVAATESQDIYLHIHMTGEAAAKKVQNKLRCINKHRTRWQVFVNSACVCVSVCASAVLCGEILRKKTFYVLQFSRKQIKEHKY